MTSRSRFYVDTPRDPSQRHSMFVSHSELTQRQDLSSNSSSATLPCTAGSVDRLTGLEEKKSSRFFTLKPKTSFSLRPFFRSSSSLASPSPGKRRKAFPLERRDSYSQTEESRPEFGEVGVQTLNASTVDVPVQTCLGAWEEGDSCGQKRYTYGRASPFWSRPYVTSSGLSNSLTAKNVPKDPLASPKLVKYAAPGDSTKQTASFLPSAVSPLNVNSCQPLTPPSQSISPDSTNLPLKNFSVKKDFGYTVSVDPQCQSDKNTLSVLPCSESYDNVRSLVSSDLKDSGKDLSKSEILISKSENSNIKNCGKDVSKNEISVPESENSNLNDSVKDLCKSETSIAESDNSLDNISQVSYDLKFCDPLNLEHPISVLKTERIDSPSRRCKSVHFDLPSSESLPKNSTEKSNKPRNVDKDFEALLKDLNVWADDTSDLQINFNSETRDKCPTPTLLSPNLKSAFDLLKQDFLSPIPETSNECNEVEQNEESTSPSLEKITETDTNVIKTNVCNPETNNEIQTVSENSIKPKRPLTRTISEYDNTRTVEISRKDTKADNTNHNSFETNDKTSDITTKSNVLEFKQPFIRSISEYENIRTFEINENDGKVCNTNDNNLKTNSKACTVSINSGGLEFKQPLIRSISEYENTRTDKINESSTEFDSLNDINLETNSKTCAVETNPGALELKQPVSSSISDYKNQSTVERNNNFSTKLASEAVFTTANLVPNAETSSLEGNVYDNVIKEENPVKTAPLPTLPSFFESVSSPSVLQTEEIIEYGKEKCCECPSGTDTESNMSFGTDFERNRFSRSSSRSSIRSSSKVGVDAINEPVNRFDSCENLDQLEEEIIRSLYSPVDGKLEDSIMNNIDLPPSESFQNSGTTATHMRRVILDHLLSGKSVEDIVPNYSKYQRSQSVPETPEGNKFKRPQKYAAILTKIENDGYDNSSARNCVTENGYTSSINSKTHQNMNYLDQKSKNESETKYSILSNTESPKKATVFLFPEDTSNSEVLQKPTLEISTSPLLNKIPSVLEVRRSSWTPQTTSDTAFSSSVVNSDVNEKLPDKKSDHYDFSNCLKPSKIQNSPFLAKINTRSMSPCNFSHITPIQNSSPVLNNCSTKRNGSPVKPPEAAGECDFASCLKPSQVQNSLFKAELSEVTANKNYNSLRSGSPLTVRMNSPVPIRSISSDHPKPSQVQLGVFTTELLEITTNKSTNSLDTGSSLNSPSPRSSNLNHPCPSPVIVEDTSNQINVPEPVKHKSEFSITLQTSPNYSSDVENTSDALQNKENMDNSVNISLESKTLNLGFNNNSAVVLDQKKFESVVSPPPPPPPPPSHVTKIVKENSNNGNSMEFLIRDRKSNLTAVEVPAESRSMTPKTPVIAELERRLQEQRNEIPKLDSGDMIDDTCPTSSSKVEIPCVGRHESNVNGTPILSNGKQYQNGSISILSEPREHSLPVSNGKSENHTHRTKLTFSPNTVITDEPPPPGAVLLDKKVTVDGDKVHTDKFYAIPVKEVLKEKTSTTKFIPAPPKYEGIGPTEDGIPIGLRNSVKKENMHNWYKTMFKSLHKADSSNDPQEYIIGYTSEPETSKNDIMVRKKSSTLDNRLKHDVNSNLNKQNYPPSVKSSIEVYNVRPRWIEDYEPGHSSVTDDEIITSRRYLPALNAPKPKYEFKNGYESDTTFTKKREQPEGLTHEQQKMWYREVQKGGEIPQFGLGKPAPEKIKEPSIGPVPPPPLNYSGQPSYQEAVRPLTLPADYSNQNGNGYCQQMNGAYEMHMRHAIHSEMQQKRSPSSNQLSPPIRTMVKSPSRSPDLRMPAQALYDFKAESPKEISLKKGDMVLVLRQLDKNWYEGEHKGVVGIFPISYVEIIPPEHASTPIKPKPEGLGRALYDFVAQTSVELTVRKGDSIALIRRVDSNWFEGIFNKKKGIVPISYIQVLQEPAERNGSTPSPRSYSVSPSSENKEKSKANSISPSTYSPSLISPLPVTQERRRLQSKKGSSLVEPVMYRALYSYSPQNTDELELQEGDSVYVVEMCDDGWFVGTSVRTGIFGIFPGNYVEKAC